MADYANVTKEGKLNVVGLFTIINAPELPYSTYVVPDVTTDDEPCYVAYHPELEGCMSHGDTPEEAIRNLREVTELYLPTLLDKSLKVPPPQGIELMWDVVVTPTRQVGVDTYISPSITLPTLIPAT